MFSNDIYSWDGWIPLLFSVHNDLYVIFISTIVFSNFWSVCFLVFSSVFYENTYIENYFLFSYYSSAAYIIPSFRYILWYYNEHYVNISYVTKKHTRISTKWSYNWYYNVEILKKSYFTFFSKVFHLPLRIYFIIYIHCYLLCQMNNKNSRTLCFFFCYIVGA